MATRFHLQWGFWFVVLLLLGVKGLGLKPKVKGRRARNLMDTLKMSADEVEEPPPFHNEEQTAGEEAAEQVIASRMKGNLVSTILPTHKVDHGKSQGTEGLISGRQWQLIDRLKDTSAKNNAPLAGEMSIKAAAALLSADEAASGRNGPVSWVNGEVITSAPIDNS